MNSFLEKFADLNPKTGVYRMVPKFLPYFKSFKYTSFAFELFIGRMINDNGAVKGRFSE